MTTIAYALQVANQFQNEGKWQQAEIIINSILAAQPKHPHALHLSGVIAYQKGDIPVAIECIQHAISRDSTVALFHSNLGEMYRQQNQIDLSIQCGQRAAELDPHSATVHANLGIAYYDAKQYAQAEACHKQALAIQPTLSTSLNNLGSIFKHYGKTQEAIDYYEAAISAAPDFIEPLNNIGTLFLQHEEFHKSLKCFHKAITLVPNFAEGHYNIGLALIGLEQYQNAELYFNKALQLNPNYAEAYYGKARIHLRMHHYAEAECFIHKAIAINAHQAEFYQLLAEIFQQQNNNSQALRVLNQAIEMHGALASLYISKGNVYMEMGDVKLAKEAFLKATEDTLSDNRLLAYYSIVQLRKNTVNSHSLQALLSMKHAMHDIAPHKREYLYFALGKCYDDMDQTTQAFEYFKQGCDLKRQRIKFNIKEYVDFTKRLVACFTQETIARLRTFANPSVLPIFIVGMPRSGGTLVEQIIASHPKVYGAGELTYFNDLIQTINQENTAFPENILKMKKIAAQNITAKYINYVQQFASNAVRITDKLPHNFIAIGLIHALLPNAKIIHVKRNPLDTCLSCYTKLFSHGQHYSYDLIELAEYYRCYELTMHHWRQVLPSNAWLEINYEDIIDNLEVHAKQLIAYCDLNWDSACLNFYQSKRTIRTASFMQVRQPIYPSSINRWRRFEKELLPLIKRFQAFAQ